MSYYYEWTFPLPNDPFINNFKNSPKVEKQTRTPSANMASQVIITGGCNSEIITFIHDNYKYEQKL